MDNDNNKKPDRNSFSNKQIIIILAVTSPILIGFAMATGLGVFDKEPVIAPDRKDITLSANEEIIFNMLDRKGYYDSTNLLDNGVKIREEIINVGLIFENTNMHCYNINWYGYSGKQIVYTETVDQVKTMLTILGYNVTDKLLDEFNNNPVVIAQLEAFCPHVENILRLPDNYNRDLGTTAFNSCMNNGLFPDKAYCDLLPRAEQ